MATTLCKWTEQNVTVVGGRRSMPRTANAARLQVNLLVEVSTIGNVGESDRRRCVSGTSLAHVEYGRGPPAAKHNAPYMAVRSYVGRRKELPAFRCSSESLFCACTRSLMGSAKRSTFLARLGSPNLESGRTGKGFGKASKPAWRCSRAHSTGLRV